MARLQLALNVARLDEAVAFYAKLFGAEPAKLRPGYANFAIADPPLKLVLFEGVAEERINHLGVEVDSPAEVASAATRLRAEGETLREEHGVCCYAEQEKFWLNDPDGSPWEVYTVIADSEESSACCTPGAEGDAGSCCVPQGVSDPVFAATRQ